MLPFMLSALTYAVSLVLIISLSPDKKPMPGIVVLFGVLPRAAGSTVLFVSLCFVIGAFLDTLFSLSLDYLGDLVGATGLPVGNQLAVTNLGLGLMTGPMVGGLMMIWLGPGAIFWVIALFYLLYICCAVLWSPAAKETLEYDVSG